MLGKKRKLFSLVTMSRLFLIVVLYCGAIAHVDWDIQILDNTKFSLFVTAGLDFLFLMCWLGLSLFGMFKLMEWVDKPTEKERDDQILEFENLLREHFPPLDNKTQSK